MRRLRVTVREIGQADAGAADAAWRHVRDAVSLAGGRAWRFRERARPARLTEFIEWSGPESPLAAADVGTGLEALDRIAPGTVVELEEAPPPAADLEQD